MKPKLSASALLAVIALMGGCSREATQAVEARTEPPPAAAEAEREVRMDAAAQKAAGVALESVEKRSLPRVLTSNGRIALNENRTWRVGAVTEGRIVRVYANPGDRVDEGQILARMHSHDIHESRANYRKALSDLERLKSTEAFTRRARDRARRLNELKAASVAELEHAETELRNAQSAVANAEIDVERTRRHLTEFLQIPAEADEDKHTDEDDLIPIKSPAGGTLITRAVTAGAVVQPSSEAFVVSDLSNLWMIAAVNEEHLGSLRPRMPVHVHVQAYPNVEFPGTIERLGDQLDPTTRTVDVRIGLPNPAGRLKPEMYAAADIELGGSEPALFVAQDALQEVGGQMVVFVRRAGDVFEVRPVRTGRVVGGLREILNGLAPGDTVAARGSFILKSQLLKSSLGDE